MKTRTCIGSVVLAAGLGGTCIGTAEANPTGGTVVAGQGAISQSGTTTTVSQQSQTLSLNWLGFSIAPGQTVQFIQPSASSIALNRVTGTDASQVYGKLLANGQVFLINPNGVLFGRGALVNVGGLVASTLNISDADFLAGNYRFQASTSNTSGAAATGSVVNQGTITASAGGSVALLGGQVSNQGTVRAQFGTVALAAGSAMTLDFDGRKLLNVKVDQSAVGALAENRQLIQADGGTVIMTAAARDALLNTVVNNTGVIEARTVQEQGGEIKLLGSSDGGTVNVGGTLDASAPNGGNGGNIETSGEHVKVADTATITTQAPQGHSGTWLIDPPDFTIAASGGDITGAALGANLDNGNVTILSSQGTVNPSGSGDINVNDNVSWNNGTTLTLSAVRNVNVNAVIANANPGNGATVTLRADSGGACVAGAAVCGTVNFDSTVGAYVQADTVNIYYNPVGSNNAAGANGSGPSYATPTDYSTDVVGTVSGTANAIMLVNDVNQLQAINASSGTRAGAYALGTNIDASATSGWNSGAGFVPLGSQTAPFTGTFDGLGQTVTGLTINRPSTNYVGLFGYASPAAVINNVGLVAGSVTGAADVGALAGWNRGAITNSYSTARVTGTNFQVGGLVGVNQGTVSSSHATGNVSALAYVGGLAGWNDLGIITDSYATGNVASTSATNIGTGGLVGYMLGTATITRSYAAGNVTAAGPDAGGLLGAYASNGLAATIIDSYATGSVHGTTNVGGLVGANLHISGSIIDSYATGAVSGTSGLGGLVGSWFGGTITGSFWDTQATGQSTSSGGGVGMTTAQLETQANFNSASAANGNVNPGWNFAGTWRMYDGHTAPLLEAFLTPLTVTADNISSTYNGNYSTAGLTNAVYSIPGAAASGHLQGASSPYANDRNAGTYEISLWSDQQGYDITLTGGTLTITRAPLTLTTSNVTKTYDGTTSAAGAAIATGGTTLYGTDTVSGGAFAYTDKNAGIGDKTVTAAGVTVNDGDGGNNYTVSYASNTTSSIIPAALTITAAANTKTYDATTSAAAIPAFSGVIAGDSVTGLAEAYATKNAGTGLTLSVTNYVVNDSNGGNNYTVSTVPDTNGTISPATITVSGITASNKPYDATTAATLNTTLATLAGKVGSDALGISATGRFADANAGTAKTVTLAGLTLTGGDKGNYVLAASGNESTTTADIAAGNVTITASNQSRVAGAPNPDLTLTYTGFVAGQDDSNLTTKPTAATSASASSPAGLYPITVSGAVDPNYTFSYVPGVLTITGNVAAVSSDVVPGYLAALASVSKVGSGNGISGEEGAAVGLGDDSSQGPTADDPFSEERAFDNRTHASDYLPRLSLEILNGGLKMPAGVP